MRILSLATALLLASPAIASDWAIAIHGGAGIISRADTSPQADKAIRSDLAKAIEAGAKILRTGGSSTDAVVAAVAVMEDSPWFNAGHGAVFNSEGKVTLDSAVMDGQTLAAGAVTGVTTTKNPVSLAHALMDKGPHVFLFGQHADSYAREKGLEQVDNTYFQTERRRKQLADLKQRNQGVQLLLPAEMRMGTVGAVARDSKGNLAAATSTGGLTGKSPGRIGDAPVIGSGTLADNRCAAVSATGSGEIFIRARVAEQICGRSQFGQEAIQQASNNALNDVKRLGGDGGVIVVPPVGEPIFSFISEGMYRGRMTSQGLYEIKVYGDE